MPLPPEAQKVTWKYCVCCPAAVTTLPRGSHRLEGNKSLGTGWKKGDGGMPLAGLVLCPYVLGHRHPWMGPVKLIHIKQFTQPLKLASCEDPRDTLVHITWL